MGESHATERGREYWRGGMGIEEWEKRGEGKMHGRRGMRGKWREYRSEEGAQNDRLLCS